jgi:hypothetical protein
MTSLPSPRPHPVIDGLVPIAVILDCAAMGVLSAVAGPARHALGLCLVAAGGVVGLLALVSKRPGLTPALVAVGGAAGAIGGIFLGTSVEGGAAWRVSTLLCAALLLAVVLIALWTLWRLLRR